MCSVINYGNNVFRESYNITTYLMETFDTKLIFLSILITTVVSIAYFIVISFFITQMDKEYFLRKNTGGKQARKNIDGDSRSRNLNYVVKSAKFIVGLFLILCGLAMLILPGQGLITISIGLSLIPFPGKHQLEQNLLARKSIRVSLNWIRSKAKKEPFIFD